MRDTSVEMQNKQYEIFFKLSPQERVRQGFEMINFGLMVLENSIKAKKTDISEKELRIEKIKRLYSDDFSQEQLLKIIEHFNSL